MNFELTDLFNNRDTDANIINNLSSSPKFKKYLVKELLNEEFQDIESSMINIYSKFGDKLKDVYEEIILKRSNIFDEIDDIDFKLKLSEYKYSNLDEAERISRVIKEEWDKSTKVSTNEYNEMIWIEDFLKNIVDDLINIAKKDGIDPSVKYIGYGGLCQVYKIGNYVLKVGEHKHSIYKDFTNNYIASSLDRSFSDSYAVEVMPYVKTRYFSETEIYDIYAKERDLGYCWSDCKWGNLGILLDDNIPIYNNLNELGYQFLGINKIEEYKQKGDIVIIDRDFSYPLNEISIEEIIRYRKANGADVIGYEENYQKIKK